MNLKKLKNLYNILQSDDNYKKIIKNKKLSKTKLLKNISLKIL